MSGLIWRRQALHDLNRLFQFLNEKNPEAARRAGSKIREAAQTLTGMPRFGRALDDDSGRREVFIPFGRGGYAIRYMIDQDNGVIILRAWHYLEEREF